MDRTRPSTCENGWSNKSESHVGIIQSDANKSSPLGRKNSPTCTSWFTSDPERALYHLHVTLAGCLCGTLRRKGPSFSWCSVWRIFFLFYPAHFVRGSGLMFSMQLHGPSKQEKQINKHPAEGGFAFTYGLV